MVIVKALLRWLDSRFPEKLTLEEVEMRFEKRLGSYEDSIQDLRATYKVCQERIIKMQDEINSLKALVQLKKPQRQGQRFDGTEPWKR